MELQDWYNENVPSKDLIYASGMTEQFIWVRDRLAGMIFTNCVEFNPDFADWQLRKKYLTVESTHTSKSCLLPVYKFTIGDTMVIQVRGNFHDWCVRVSNTQLTSAHFPDWMVSQFDRGFYEGMATDKSDFEFCVGSREVMYTVLWHMINELI